MNAYELAYEYVQHTNRCIFLTGKAGTGKTTFLRRLRQECPKQMAVVAPTGVAAINAEGVTIHSLFQLPPQVFIPSPEARKQLFSEMQMRAHKQRVLRNLELLVIDEVSMVRSDLLDTIDAVLRHYKHMPNHPFGGVQVLVIGDLFQLSPVAREEEWRIMQDYYTGPYFFQALVFQQLRPIYIELDHVFRQTNIDFVEILNQVRNNSLTAHSLQMLNARYQPDFQADEQSEYYITLSTHNRKVDAINQHHFESLSGKVYRYSASIKDTFPESMYPMDEVLTLRLGARVMFTKNDSSAEKRYYNGKLGIVSHLTDKTITVTCDGEKPIDVQRETWENLRYVAQAGSETIHAEVIGSFSHYPLRLAWAITIHKAQGLTFDRVVIDAADAFAAGQVYVALSRCRQLEGIVLLTKIPSHALTNAPEVLAFTQSQQQPLSYTQQQLQLAQREYMIVLFCALYDFRELINRCYALMHMVGKMDSVQHADDTYFSTIITDLEAVHTVGERFQQQLRQLIYHDQIDMLKERLRAASKYYAPKLHQLLQCISTCPLRSNDKGDASLLGQSLFDIYAELARKSYLQSQVASTPTISGYFKARAAFRLKEPNFLIYTTKKKARMSATAFQSLSLLEQGYRLSEIAQMRKITLPTVVRHLRQFLGDGLIKLSDVFPADRKYLR